MSMWKKRFKSRRSRRRRRRISSSRTKGVKSSRNIARLAKLAFIGVIVFIVGSFILFPLLAITLPSPDNIVRREGFSTKILDRNGEALYDIYIDERRTAIKLDDVPDYLKQATISIEDKNFYEHEGFDPFGMLRGISRFFTRGRAQGGSTLTQQLVKNVLLSSERTITRKIKEFIITVQIEKKFSKDEILEMYMNEMPYGGTAYGVESASEVYFGKKAKDLDLIESAILAGLPQSPSRYSPYSSDPDAYMGRTEQVLRRMREDGYIDKGQEESAVEQLADFKFQERGASFKAPHFVQYVQRILEERYGENVVESGGLIVTTTLDLELQEEAQEIVRDEIEKVEDLRITNGASVVINPETGEILAMVGSKDFNDPNYDGQVNVTMSLRQPGSAIKPVTYVTALKKGYTASTLLMDVPTEFPGGENLPIYKPENYDGKYRGPMQVRFTLANSINVAAVKMLAMVGVKDVLETAYDMGITSLEPSKKTLSRVGLSLTLGGGEVRLLELTGAFSAFMNKGYKVDPTAILKIEDVNGKILEEVEPKKRKRVLKEEEAFIIADILSDNNARSALFGTNSLLNIPGKQIAVKTGTTNDKRDNWTVGGNSQAVVGVWVGNNDNTPMTRVASGISGASPIWRKILLSALDGKPSVSFNPPSGIVTAAVDTVSGYAAHDGFPSRIEYFVRGTEPGEDPVHKKLKVCKTDGKLATPSDIASGNYDEKEFYVFKEEDATGGIDGVNKWQEGILAWLETQSDEKYRPPNEYCGTEIPVNVEFVRPNDQDSNLGGDINVKIRADSTNDIVEVELEVDGERVRRFTSPPYEHTINLDNGVHTLRAKAKDSAGKESDRSITIGVGVAWDWAPATPTPVPTSTPTPTPTLSPSPVLTP